MADALLVTSSFLPGRGGIETYLADLCSELAPRLAVFAPARRENKAVPRDLGYPVTGFPRRLLVPTGQTTNAIRTAAEAHQTDRVIFGTPWPLALTGPALNRSGLRYAVIAHGAELVAPSVAPVLRRRLKRALAQADLLLGVSNYTANKLRDLSDDRGTGPDVDVLRALVDLTRFRPEADATGVRTRLSLGPDDKVVLCLGRLVRRKGIHRMIDVLPALSARVPPVTLVVAGRGPQERSLRWLARRRRARVVFAGAVADDETPGFYAAADVFVLPVADRWFGLEAEGLGVVLLEAAASATPCVTGSSGGSPEAVIHRETGFVVDARDGQALMDAVVWLLEHPDEARRMGSAGRSYVRKEFAERDLPESLLQWLG